MNKMQSLWQGVQHSAISLIGFGIPFLLLVPGDWKTWTLGGILAVIGNWSKSHLTQ